MFTIIFYLLSLLGMTGSKTHIGKNIARIRDLKGMKQETLAELMNITQAGVSRIEQSENIEDDTLKRVASALGITPEAVKQFNGEALFNNIQTNSDTATNNWIVNYQLGQIDKLTELYEALLKSERDKIRLLEEQIQILKSR